MASITIAVSDNEHRVPGFAVEAVPDLMCMHDPAVRRWIAEHRLPEPGCVLVADPEWVNRGDGTESLTFPVDERDAEVVAAKWEHTRSLPRRADESDA
jgi:hypothetical protein